MNFSMNFIISASEQGTVDLTLPLQSTLGNACGLSGNKAYRKLDLQDWASSATPHPETAIRSLKKELADQERELALCSYRRGSDLSGLEQLKRIAEAADKLWQLTGEEQFQRRAHKARRDLSTSTNPPSERNAKALGGESESP